MSPPIKTVIVGAGQQGKKRARAILSGNTGLELVGLADSSLAALEAARSEFGPGLKYDGDWFDAVAAEGVQAVIVATSSDQHEEIATKSRNLGKHTLVEKPLGSDLESSLRIARTEQDAPSVLKVGLNYPYRQTASAAIALFEEGLIGKIVHARATIGHAQFVGNNEPRTRSFLEHGSSLEDLGIHAIDLGRLFMGEQWLWAAGHVTRRQVFDMDVEEVALAIFTMEDGRTFTVTSSFVEHRPWMGLRFELLGTNGRLVFSMAPNTLELMLKQPNIQTDEDAERALLAHKEEIDRALKKHGASPPERYQPRLLRRPDPRLYYTECALRYGNEDLSLVRELKEFAAKIRGEPASDCYRDAGDCIAAQALIEAARRSSRWGGRSFRVDIAQTRAGRTGAHR